MELNWVQTLTQVDILYAFIVLVLCTKTELKQLAFKFFTDFRHFKTGMPLSVSANLLHYFLRNKKECL